MLDEEEETEDSDGDDAFAEANLQLSGTVEAELYEEDDFENDYALLFKK